MQNSSENICTVLIEGRTSALVWGCLMAWGKKLFCILAVEVHILWNLLPGERRKKRVCEGCVWSPTMVCRCNAGCKWLWKRREWSSQLSSLSSVGSGYPKQINSHRVFRISLESFCRMWWELWGAGRRHCASSPHVVEMLLANELVLRVHTRFLWLWMISTEEPLMFSSEWSCCAPLKSPVHLPPLCTPPSH